MPCSRFFPPSWREPDGCYPNTRSLAGVPFPIPRHAGFFMRNGVWWRVCKCSRFENAN